MNKEDFLKKVSNPNIYLHITKDLNHNGEFFVRIPEDRLIRWSEDDKTPRICVAEDLNGCLTAVGIEEETLIKVFFVDIEKLNLKEHIYDWEHLYKNDLVTDAVFTKEAWITKDFSLDDEDSAIISLDCISDDEMPYLVEYKIQKQAEKLNLDVVDYYVEKFNYYPDCISYIRVDDNFSILDKKL